MAHFNTITILFKNNKRQNWHFSHASGDTEYECNALCAAKLLSPRY